MAEKSQLSFLASATKPRAELLGLQARQTVEGLQSISPRGSFRGYARDFTGHREFSAGQELRHIDWRAGAGRGRSLRGQMAEGSNIPAQLVVDGSASMNYGSGEISKFDYALSLAASFSYLLLRQADPVQLSFFNESVRDCTPLVHGAENFSVLINQMATWNTSGSTKIGESVRELSEKLKPGGVVVLISDFLEEEDSWIEAVERIRFQRCVTLLIRVMDPQEIGFNFEGPVEFEALEGEEKLTVHPEQIRLAYLEELERFTKTMKEVAARCESHYLLADSSRPVSEILESYLLFRRQPRRG